MKLLLLLSLWLRPAAPDSLLVVSWNVENFLDYRADTTGRHTSRRFYTKCNAISKTLLLIAGRYGRIPDAVALMEVGNRKVLERLISTTPLRKLDYEIVHYESPDRRGIDCALLFRQSSLTLLRSSPCHLYDSSGALMRTRDILLVEFDGLDILVNHHPSKVGSNSGPRRAVAMARMTALMDSLQAVGHPRLLSVGDFNDDVWHIPVILSGSEGPRCFAPLSMTEQKGTIKYNGAWEKIDGYFARGNLSVREGVFADASLSEPDRAFGGVKPRRAFSGPRWKGGVSDHYPVVLLVSW